MTPLSIREEKGEETLICQPTWWPINKRASASWCPAIDQRHLPVWVRQVTMNLRNQRGEANTREWMERQGWLQSGCWSTLLLSWLYLEWNEEQENSHLNKIVDFSIGLHAFDRDCGLGSVPGVCSSLGRTPHSPCLCCLISRMKVTILMFFVKHSETHWQRSCGNAELSQLKWLLFLLKLEASQKAELTKVVVRQQEK